MEKNKKNKQDYLPINLPHTRKEQFFDLLKNDFFTLIKLGLVLLLFALPFIVIVILRAMFLYNVDTSDTNTQIAVQLIYYGTTILTTMIFSIGLAGVLKILKRLIWNEPIFAVHDFFEGIKENALNFLVYAFLLSSLYAASNIVIIFNIGGKFVKFLPNILLLVFVFPSFLCSIAFSFMYQTKLIDRIKSGLILSIKCYPSVFLSVLSLAILLLINFIPYVFVKVIVFSILLVFYVPIALLGTFINQIRIFDKYINPTFYPDKVNCGLYKEE